MSEIEQKANELLDKVFEFIQEYELDYLLIGFAPGNDKKIHSLTMNNRYWESDLKLNIDRLYNGEELKKPTALPAG